MASRCRGVLHAAGGNTPAAIDALEDSLIKHQHVAMPFEESRTRLLLGTLLCRAGRRRDARRELEAALTVFNRLGTPVQAAQARAELSGVSGRSRADTGLTAAEQRIVALVAAGRTSREVATTLFMSVRTVDSHLGRIYRKLGLRSRTELALWVSSQPTSEPATQDAQ